MSDIEVFQSKGYKWFVDNYSMCHDRMFKNYYKKLRMKYKYLVSYDMPFQRPVWTNASIEEIFEFVRSSGSTSITIQNNQCENPFKEPIEYIFYDTEDWQSEQKIYGVKHERMIRMNYRTNEMYFCKFKTQDVSFSCNKDLFSENPNFLLFIGRYEYNTKTKHIFTLVNSTREKLETEDFEKIQRFIKLMKDKKYDGIFDKVADRMDEII